MNQLWVEIRGHLSEPAFFFRPLPGKALYPHLNRSREPNRDARAQGRVLWQLIENY